MTYEKSCGGIVYRMHDGKPEYLLVLNKKGGVQGHWGFPKGHVEGSETEHETARREIKEEAGIDVEFTKGFRTVTTYSPRQNVTKDVVYFAARAMSEDISIQLSEIGDYMWADYEKAMKTLTNDKNILKKANAFLKKLEQ